jgi:hypothetical protein
VALLPNNTNNRNQKQQKSKDSDDVSYISGVLFRLKRDSLLISLKDDSLPDDMSTCKLVRLGNEITYKRMLEAMESLSLYASSNLSSSAKTTAFSHSLLSVLFGLSKPVFTDTFHMSNVDFYSSLNEVKITRTLPYTYIYIHT